MGEFVLRGGEDGDTLRQGGEDASLSILDNSGTEKHVQYGGNAGLCPRQGGEVAILDLLEQWGTGNHAHDGGQAGHSLRKGVEHNGQHLDHPLPGFHVVHHLPEHPYPLDPHPHCHQAQLPSDDPSHQEHHRVLRHGMEVKSEKERNIRKNENLGRKDKILNQEVSNST